MFTSNSNAARWALVAFCLLGLGQANGQSIRQPQDGVLLLKHGTTLSGYITPTGNHFVVLLGDSGEARVPAANVTAIFNDLQEAYKYKQARLENTLPAHIALAQWCLQQRIYARAADQLLIAEQQFGKHPHLEALHRRLVEIAQAATVAQDDSQQNSAIAQVNFEEDVTEVAHSAIDGFTSAVQPLLLNRCASGGCHNMRGTSDFVLFRPFLGQSTTRRMTERNLEATLQFVDRDNPMESSLLRMAVSPHGGSSASAIADREQHQLDIISSWLQSLAPERKPKQPRFISPTNELLYQPKQTNTRDMASTTPSSETSTRSKRPTNKSGDPFDPAPFNELHHGTTR